MELDCTGKQEKEPCPSECRDCSDACQVEAISATGKVSHNLCIRHSGANPLLTHLLNDREAKEKFSF